MLPTDRSYGFLFSADQPIDTTVGKNSRNTMNRLTADNKNETTDRWINEMMAIHRFHYCCGSKSRFIFPFVYLQRGGTALCLLCRSLPLNYLEGITSP
jgi:hypothetical protein